MTIQEIALHCTKGSSDKIYLVQIESATSGGYVVNFQYGRRGAALHGGTKTPTPVTLAEAEKIFNRLSQEKQKKGYNITNSVSPMRVAPANAATVIPAGSAAAATAPVQESQFDVQLLNAIEESELDYYFKNPNFCVQEKHDGNRMVLQKKGSDVTALNRRGLPVAFSQQIADAVLNLPHEDLTFDGEIVGDEFFAFDCPQLDADLRDEPYMTRAQQLFRVLRGQSVLKFGASLESSEHGKRALFEKLKTEGKEGAVFKDLFAPYEAGRPNSGGSQLKYKFTAEATCRVKSVNQKRSVLLEVRESDAAYREVGNCTIPANQPIPQVGELVEVRYLYAYPNGSLYQPVFKTVRTDKTDADLHISLKFKRETATSDDE
jgi:bifunctional non-homologous end joining protein LigD